MSDPYFWLTFAQTALPTIGVTALFVLVVILCVKRGPEGEALLIEAAKRLFDLLLPNRPAAKARARRRRYRRLDQIWHRNGWN